MKRLIRPIAFLALLASGVPASAVSVKLAPGGEAKALVVGANVHRGAKNLFGAEADARDLERTLRAAGFKVVPLVKENATRNSLVREMGKLVDEAKPNDLIVITFAGHGARVSEYPFWKGLNKNGLNAEYILPDFERYGEGTKEVIVDKEIKAWLSRLHARGAEVVLLADTCHGGGLTRAPFKEAADDQSVRYTRDAFVPPGENLFRPIDVKPEEARADISRLPHVTFLSGVDEDHLVPEVSISGEPTLRGALSYAFARLMEGRGIPEDGVVSRRTLYGLRQLVRQYSHNQQDPLFQPQSLDGDPTIYDRPLFRLTEASKEQAATFLPSVKLALVNGDPSIFERIGRPTAPLQRVADPQTADLVWDIGAKNVFGHGDLILSSVEPPGLPGLIDRTSVLAALRKMSVSRPLDIALKDGGRRYSMAEKDQPTLLIDGVGGRHLLVFNLAADGKIQMLRPPKRGYSSVVNEDRFSDLRFDVAEPFGADTIVAVAASQSPTELESWLWSADGLVAAGQLSAKLSEAIARDPTIKIGYTGLYTIP